MGADCSKPTAVGPTASYPDHLKVALIGIGCQFAGGVNSADTCHQALKEGRDCTCRVPSDRFDASHWTRPGAVTGARMYTDRGGYLETNPYDFDTTFFKMPKDEADHLDPMVRMLLMETYRALEDAGIPPSSIRGSNTGVFMGGTASEYTQFASVSPENINKFSNSGTNSCMLANRIAYEFDFKGPSYSVDTACSSSLYAIVNACEALRSGQCDMAVVGGVNLILLPNTTIGFCQAEMMAKDGRCKSFDAAADGYARGEGVAVLILKRKDDAIASADDIYAILLGGRLCNDGKTMGIANPSQEAQEGMLKACMDASCITPTDVVYLEAHGTGTQAGDRAELSAVGNVLGRRRDVPLPVGSAKSNFAHTEGAAGAMGVIKAAMVLYHREILPNHGYINPRTDMELTSMGLRIPTCRETIYNTQPIAMVSSFGFGGANASIAMSAAPLVRHDNVQDPHGLPLFVSGHSEESALARLTQIHKLLTDDKVSFHDICATTALHLEHHSFRLAFYATTKRDCLDQIEKTLAEDNKVISPARNDVFLVFVFNGMGSQWPHMGRGLLKNNTTFRKVIQEFDREMKLCGEKWKVEKVITKGKLDVNETRYAQPCICAVQIAIAAVLNEMGFSPDLVLGHSVGEVAAAHASGILSMRETVRLIVLRGRVQQKLAGKGAMIAVVGASIENDKDLLQNCTDVSTACVNSDSQIVYSGNRDAIKDLTAKLRSRSRKVIELKVQNAFHSFQVDAILDEFRECVSPILTENPMPTVQMVSTVTGDIAPAMDIMTPKYWCNNMRDTVNLKKAMTTTLNITDRPLVITEIGADGTLQPALNENILKSDNTTASVLCTLQRPAKNEQPDELQLMSAALKLHTLGCKMDFNRFFQLPYKRIHLPPYPFQCSTFKTVSRVTADILNPQGYHPMLQKEWQTDGGRVLWRSEVGTFDIPWVCDHKLEDDILFPGAGFIDMIVAALLKQLADQTLDISNLKFETFMPIDEERTTVYLDTSVADNDQGYKCRVYTTISQRSVVHCTCQVTKHNTSSRNIMPARVPLALRDNSFKTFRPDAIYEAFQFGGFNLGPSFQSLGMAYCSEQFSEAMFDIVEPECITLELGKYVLHPGILDAVFQAVAFLDTQYDVNILNNLQRKQQVPSYVDKIQLDQDNIEKLRKPSLLVVFIQMRHTNDTDTTFDANICSNNNGEVLVKLHGIKFTTLQQQDLSKSTLPLKWRLGWTNVAELDVTDATRSIVSQPDVMIISDKNANCSDIGLHQTRPLSYQPTAEHLSDTKYIMIILSPGNDQQSAFNADVIERLKDIQSLLLKLSDLDVTIPIWLITVRTQSVLDDDSVSMDTMAVSSLQMVKNTEIRDLHIFALDVTSIGQALALLSGDTLVNLNEDELAVRQQQNKLIVFARRFEYDELSLLRRRKILYQWCLHGSSDLTETAAETESVKSKGFVKITGTGYSLYCVDADNNKYVCPVTEKLSSHARKSLCVKVMAPMAGKSTIRLLHNCINFLKFVIESTIHASKVFVVFPERSYELECIVKVTAMQEKGWVITGSAATAELIVVDLTGDTDVQIHPGNTTNILCVTDSQEKFKKFGRANQMYITNNKWSAGIEALKVIDRILTNQSSQTVCSRYDLQTPNVEWDLRNMNDNIYTDLPAEMTIETNMYENGFTAAADSCYVVVGGTRGLGLKCAEWLFECGANHVTVLGRKKSTELVHEMQVRKNLGKVLNYIQTDVTEPNEIRNAVHTLVKNGMKIEGIFHSVVCYKDKTFRDLDERAWTDSLHTKARSALILHALSVEFNLPLKYFVLFSSATTILGSESQANYVAANVYLQALAKVRRRAGLPAVAISFGTINDVGGAAAIQEFDVVKFWRDRGIGDLDSHTALCAMGNLLVSSHHEGILGPNTDIQKFADVVLGSNVKNVPSRIKDIYSRSKSKGAFAQAMKSYNASEAKGKIYDVIVETIVKNESMDRKTVENAGKISELGIDSMSLTKLSAILTETFNVTVATMDLLNDKMTLKLLCDRVYNRLQDGASDAGDTSVKGTQMKSVEIVREGTAGSVLLFPPMPGGRTAFMSLIMQLSAVSTRSIYLVKVAGWEDRPNDEPSATLEDTIREVVTDIKLLMEQGHLQTDVLFYGHSTGGLMAYETSHALKQAGMDEPFCLIVGAWMAPKFKYNWPDMPSFVQVNVPSVKEVIHDLQKLQIFDKRIEDNTHYIKRYVKSIVANMKIVIEYRRPARDVLDLKLVVIAGKKDTFCTSDMQRQWADEVDGPIQLHTVPGGHLFVSESETVKQILYHFM